MALAAWDVRSKRIISTLSKDLQEGKYKGTEEESLLKGLQPGTPPVPSMLLWSSLRWGAHPRRPHTPVDHPTDNVLGRISHQKSIKRSPAQYRATLQPADRTVRERARPDVGVGTARGANAAIAAATGRALCARRAI